MHPVFELLTVNCTSMYGYIVTPRKGNANGSRPGWIGVMAIESVVYGNKITTSR